MESGPSIKDHALENVAEEEARHIEDTLWWLKGRKAIIRAFLGRATTRGPATRLMDIGCGSGGNLDVLAEFGKVVGFEPSETLARRATQRQVAESVVRRDVLAPGDCRDIDVFTMFDVLEHIEDDGEFLRGLRGKAPQRHTLLVSVPACPFLFGDHDRILHHHRRYSSRRLRAVLEGAGYSVTEDSYFFFFLFPIAVIARIGDLARRAIGRERSAVELGSLPPVLSSIAGATLRVEAWLSERLRLPIGLWLFALAESHGSQHSDH